MGLSNVENIQDPQILNHFLIKILEYQNVDQDLLLKLQQNLFQGDLQQTISQLPNFEQEDCYHLLNSCLQLNSQQPIKKKKKQEYDPDLIDFQQYDKHNLLKKDKNIQPQVSNQLIMKKWIRLKTVLGHQKKDNFHNNNEPDEQTIPLYNIIFDNSGKLIITGDDNGLIKIWSSLNCQLLNQFRGHTDLIHALELSPCNKYLVSCSQDQTIRVWSLSQQKPVAVLGQNIQDSILTISFYKNYLITLTEKCQILAYKIDDFIENDGKLYKNEPYYRYQIKYQLEEGASLCVNDKSGVVCFGGSRGEIIIWESIEQLAHKQHLDSFMWNAHSKSCHTLFFNKQGDKLLSGSLDGNAKLWNWNQNNFLSNQNIQPYQNINFGGARSLEQKCWTVNFSKQGRYAIGTFSKKIKKPNQVNAQMQSNIVIFDIQKNEVIHRLSEETCGIQMDKEIYVIDPHPFQENIILSGDFDGNAILWDIKLGIILNVFKELAMPIQQPNLETPIVDGRFSPDGLSFVVSTYYGNYSLYGYGNKEIYNYSYYDQFNEKDYLNIHNNEDMVVLSSDNFQQEQEVWQIHNDVILDQKKNPKEIQIQVNFKELSENQFFNSQFMPQLETLHNYEYFDSFLKIKQQNKKKLKFWKLYFIQQKFLANSILKQQAQNIKNKKLVIHQQNYQIAQQQQQLQQQNIQQEQEHQSQDIQDNSWSNFSYSSARSSSSSSSNSDPSENNENLRRLQQRRSSRSVSQLQQRNQQRPSENQILTRNQSALNQNIEQQQQKASKPKKWKILSDSENSVENIKKVVTQQISNKLQKEIKVSDENRYQTRKSKNNLKNLKQLSSKKKIKITQSKYVTRHQQKMQEQEQLESVKFELKYDSPQKEVKQVKNESQILNQFKEVLICKRCQNNINTYMYYQKCQLCSSIYDMDCCEYRGHYYKNKFYCFNHDYRQFKNVKQIKNITFNCDRQWLDDNSIYIPQINDLVYYLYDFHDLFNVYYQQTFEFQMMPQEDFNQLKEVQLMQISNIDYIYPQQKDQNCNIELPIFMEISLVNNEQEDLKFKCLYANQKLDCSNLIIEKNYYDYLINQVDQLQIGDFIKIKEDKYIYLGKIQSNFVKKIKAQKYSINQKQVPQEFFIFQIQFNEKYQKNYQDFTYFIETYDLLISKMQDNIFEPFQSEIDKKQYFNYLGLIQFEMNIDKIIQNINQQFYRNSDQLIAHIRIIAQNCNNYNHQSSLIAQRASQVSDILIDIVYKMRIEEIKKKYRLKFRYSQDQAVRRRSDRIKKLN